MGRFLNAHNPLYWCTKTSEKPIGSLLIANPVSRVPYGNVRKEPERKKENRHPKGGMGGRHAATTQGF